MFEIFSPLLGIHKRSMTSFKDPFKIFLRAILFFVRGIDHYEIPLFQNSGPCPLFNLWMEAVIGNCNSIM